MKKICSNLLKAIGEDPTREGLIETPKRFEKAWKFWAKGYKQDVKDLMTTFKTPKKTDQLVVVRGIDFYSHCEHHLAPFYGTVNVGYLPDHRVIGVSKVARLVDMYARRLQIQERLTQQVGEALLTNLNARGVGVVVRGVHLCMRSRGVEKQNSEMVTSVMLGEFRKHDSQLRQEFLELIK